MVKKTTAILVLGFLFGVSIIILGIAIFQSKTVRQEIDVYQRRGEIDRVVKDKGATLSFGAIPPATAGEEFTVPIVLDSPQFHVVSLDVWLVYDGDAVEVVSIQNGAIFEQYTGEVIENENGSATFSLAVAPETTGFTGTSTVAMVTMRGNLATSTPLSFSFEKNNRNDSNVAVADLPTEDVLEKVENTIIVIN